MASRFPYVSPTKNLDVGTLSFTGGDFSKVYLFLSCSKILYYRKRSVQTWGINMVITMLKGRMSGKCLIELNEAQ